MTMALTLRTTLHSETGTDGEGNSAYRKPFQKIKIEKLPNFVNDILTEAKSNTDTNAHERQWSMSVVAPLLRSLCIYLHAGQLYLKCLNSKVFEWGYEGDIRALSE